MRALLSTILVLAGLLAQAAAETPAKSCAALTHVALPNTSVTLAQLVAPGAFKPADPTSAGFSDLPEFCRVAATLNPSSDSDIKVEVWLPIAGWNGKFIAMGNGGWGGSIDYEAMSEALHRGYATSATDDGHAGKGAAFLLGHPEKLVDFAYRSQHEMTVKAKAIIHTFYGADPKYSYWDGCSGGGREGLLQASRYPGEFNGIVAGAPANLRRNAWALWLANAAFKNPADYIPPAKYPMIHQAVLNACDTLDGLKDGLIDDPTLCHFDPKVLQCTGEDKPSCLTPRQVQTAKTLLSPAVAHTGQEIFPGLAPGAELRWGRLAAGPEPAALFADYFKYVVFKNPAWDWRTFDLERDSALANQVSDATLGLNPNLKQFAAAGGKLLLYQGWADQQVAPGATIEFYQATSSLSPSSSWVRLFMAPGMAHCGGGEGPDNFDEITAMEQWVEKGKAPDQIIATHSANGKTDRSRPLCPYPQVAAYLGSGSTDNATNFICRSPHAPGK